MRHKKLNPIFNSIKWKIQLFKLPIALLLLLVSVSACQHGYYVPRTANVPRLDSTKKSDVNFRIGFANFELQQNHLISNKLVFQNNIALRLATKGVNGVGELGLGYYFNKNYSNLLVLGAGISHQDYEYLLAHWSGYDASYVELQAPKQYNFFAQYSKRIEKLSVPGYHVNFYERTDFCFIEDIKMKYSSNYRGNLPYFVQDFGSSIYIRPIRLNINFGFKLAYTWIDSQIIDEPLLQRHVYSRISFRF